MLSYIIGLLIIAAALYVAWKARTDAGFDWKKGIGALLALIAGLWVMLTDWLNHIVQ